MYYVFICIQGIKLALIEETIPRLCLMYSCTYAYMYAQHTYPLRYIHYSGNTIPKYHPEIPPRNTTPKYHPEIPPRNTTPKYHPEIPPVPGPVPPFEGTYQICSVMYAMYVHMYVTSSRQTCRLCARINRLTLAYHTTWTVPAVRDRSDLWEAASSSC